jgi:hypothetical protein
MPSTYAPLTWPITLVAMPARRVSRELTTQFRWLYCRRHGHIWSLPLEDGSPNCLWCGTRR